MSGGAIDPLRARVAALRADPEIVTLEGFHALKHAVRFGAGIELAVTDDAAAVQALADALAPDLRPGLAALLTVAAPATFAALEAAPGRRPALLAFARRPRVDPDAVLALPGPAPVVALETPRHAGNLGAVVRVAAAAGAAGVFSTGSLDPWGAGALRGSAGLHFALPVARLDALARGDRPLVALDPGGVALEASTVLPERAVLAFGGERHGLSAATLRAADQRLRIPMAPGVSSLNLATAVAVVLFTIPPARTHRSERRPP